MVFVTGESYVGHYIPAFASRVHVDLGFAIGNGLTDPAIQYKPYTDYALDHKLITKTDYKNINTMIPECENDIQLCDAYASCTSIFGSILDIVGNINYYDIRKKCGGQLC
ncbi:hypothetical protein POM88_038635 [Heracleum sosnowskyi]|uniref:Carboxypeptidase n=1 Tax=Heracleum sosnowskyi TaxID=360622 RepID=A0AAD8HB18_9APIA|nr:hypothetical protein POM88_038635 [Heracleum sosnowskyi]